jgi:hypothetical protein
MASKLQSRILPGGIMRAIHVWTPGLVDRLTNGGDMPVQAVRSSLYNYSKMQLYRQVDILGPSKLVEMFDKPLPGTAGRGVSVVMSDHALQVWYDGPIITLDTPDDADPKELQAKAMQVWKGTRKPVKPARKAA